MIGLFEEENVSYDQVDIFKIKSMSDHIGFLLFEYGVSELHDEAYHLNCGCSFFGLELIFLVTFFYWFPRFFK